MELKTINCPDCKKILVEDGKAYLKKYPLENYMVCCYCNKIFPLDNLLVIDKVKRRKK